MKKAYFARGMYLYGTAQEKRDILLIEWLGFEVFEFGVVVDEQVKIAKERGLDVMKSVFLPIVEKADCLFFRSMPDMRIGAGIMEEINFALSLNIPVFELPSSLSTRGMDIDATRAFLREIGER